MDNPEHADKNNYLAPGIAFYYDHASSDRSAWRVTESQPGEEEMRVNTN